MVKQNGILSIDQHLCVVPLLFGGQLLLSFTMYVILWFSAYFPACCQAGVAGFYVVCLLQVSYKSLLKKSVKLLSS
jgi:hypothetical protein